MILFGNPTNVAVRKARCSAALKGIELQQISILRGSPDPIFRAVSPAGDRSALRDGKMMAVGSFAIIEHFDRIGTGAPIVPIEVDRRLEALSLAQIADGPLAQAISVIFQNSVFIPRFLGKPGNLQLVKRVQRGGLPRILQVVENALAARTRDRTVDIADLSLFAQCICLPLSGFGIDAKAYPRTSALVARMLGLEAIARVVDRDARLLGSDLAMIRGLMTKESEAVELCA